MGFTVEANQGCCRKTINTAEISNRTRWIYIMYEKKIPIRIKCSNTECDHVFMAVDNLYWVMNDPGYVVEKCPICGSRTKFHVNNMDLFEKHSDTVCVVEDGSEDERLGCPEGEIIIDPTIINKPEVWAPIEPSKIWENNKCHFLFHERLKKAFPKIDDELKGVCNAYLAGQLWVRDPKWLFIKVAGGSRSSQAIYVKEINSEKDFNSQGLKLIHHSGALLSDAIDGLYTRDESISILNTLFNRWKTIGQLVIVAVPFIGFQYKGARSEEQVIRYWKWLGGTLDVNKTFFITRKSTFTQRKKTGTDGKEDFVYLKKWGMLDELANEAERESKIIRKKGDKIIVNEYPKVLFKQNFHSKFYAGIIGDKVEVLSGSYNIHEGDVLENLSFRIYSLNDFIDRYMLRMFPKLSFAIPAEETDQYVEIVVDAKGDIKTYCKQDTLKFIKDNIIALK